MNAMRRLALASAVILLSVACETIVEIDLPEHEPLLVVNSHFSPAGEFRVSVGRSAGITDPQRPGNLYGASVELWSGDEHIASLRHVKDGFYAGSGVRPEVGRPYVFRVASPGFAPVQASGAVPEAVAFSVGHRFVRSADHHSPSVLEITIEFDDPPSRSDYYLLQVLARHPEYPDSEYPVHFRVEDRSILDSFWDGFDPGDSYMNEAFFRDVTFNGETVSLNLSVDVHHYYLSPPPGEYSVRLSTLSEAFYRYEQTRELQRRTRDNPFAEPVQIFSNVQGGLGVVSGYSWHQVRLPSDWARAGH